MSAEFPSRGEREKRVSRERERERGGGDKIGSKKEKEGTKEKDDKEVIQGKD